MVDLNSVTEATLNSDGQIILTAEDGHGKLVLHFQFLLSAKLYAFHQVKVYHVAHFVCVLYIQFVPGGDNIYTNSFRATSRLKISYTLYIFLHSWYKKYPVEIYV